MDILAAEEEESEENIGGGGITTHYENDSYDYYPDEVDEYDEDYLEADAWRKATAFASDLGVGTRASSRVAQHFAKMEVDKSKMVVQMQRWSEMTGELRDLVGRCKLTLA